MLLLGSSFETIPILSLRNGLSVGRVIGHLVNPHKLRVDALWCKIGSFKEPYLLLPQDIREVTPKGIIVNDRDVIVLPEDVVKLKDIIELNYEILGKKVVSGRLPLGKACDYAIDQTSFLVQKIYVTPSIWGRIKEARLTIDRSQIIEVSHTYIKVKDTLAMSEASKRLAPKRAYSPSASSAALTSE